MQRIFMRSGKSPFEYMSPEQVSLDNTLGNNVGNLLYAYAVYKILNTKNSIIYSNHYSTRLSLIDKINNDYDLFVLPMANSFRDGFAQKSLPQLTALLKKIKIPCVVVGVGCQHVLDISTIPSFPFDDVVKEFAAVVSDRSASIGVRGEFTKSYLNKLGFYNVEVIGCPSMYFNGPSLDIVKKNNQLNERSSHISYNLTPNLSKNVYSFIQREINKYTNSCYVGQKRKELLLCLWGASWGKHLHDIYPNHIRHPEINKTTYFTEFKPWLEFLKTQDIVFGTRLHGNICAVLAGTPNLLIAHDSRTLELAKFHNIPHLPSNKITSETELTRFYEETDFSMIKVGHEERFNNFLNFLEKNGLEHIYQNGQESTFSKDFDQFQYPPGVRPISSINIDEAIRRASYLYATYNKFKKSNKIKANKAND